MIRVIVTGASGRMGRQVCRAVWEQEDMMLVGAVDVANVGENISALAGIPAAGPAISSDLAQVIRDTGPRVMVDFTQSEVAADNAKVAVAAGVSPVIGTTGLTNRQLDELHVLCEEKQVGALVAPNFAIGAVLMMQFSRAAARFFPSVEIIELHHDQKRDAPSGTALKTAELIQQERETRSAPEPEMERLAGVRGGDYQGIKVHSVRLPGLVAHQEVIFGGQGETLTIRHDSLSRDSFMPGVLLGIRRVGDFQGLVYGLERLIETM